MQQAITNAILSKDFPLEDHFPGEDKLNKTQLKERVELLMAELKKTAIIHPERETTPQRIKSIPALVRKSYGFNLEALAGYLVEALGQDVATDVAPVQEVTDANDN